MTGIPMTRITLLTQDDCHLCDHAKQVLAKLAGEFPLQVEEIRVDTDDGRHLATQHAVLFSPGILVDGHLFGYGRLSERKLRRHLTRTMRASQSQG